MNTTAQRTITALIATTFAALALTACSSDNGNDTEAQETATSSTHESATTSLNGPPDDYAGSTVEDAQQLRREQWAKAHPDELDTMTDQFESITGETITPGEALKVTQTICGLHAADTDEGTNLVQEYRTGSGTITTSMANKLVDTALTYCDSL